MPCLLSTGLSSMARKRKPSGRKPGGRRERPYVLIVCEGDTELNYFKALKRRFRANWLNPEKPDETNPMAILEYAIKKEKKLKGDGRDVETWVVFDSETAVIAKERSYRECIIKALSRKINVANSSPCFEYWLLIHFKPGINVFEPSQAKAELAKPGRIEGYTKPKLPHDNSLWDIYSSGSASAAARSRRAELEELGDDPRFGTPVTYVDTLVDRLVEISKY